ncbi:M12 family metallo-peptidase [Hymenobacter sp. ASUV-10]|uniref:M12 family metallo-peptidase n=1 Tax=Hymenobacter aranciens TaxID=3063996 RepID=A0ABT9B8G0_9BACT|nr:zinc-dependent metalloprotease family protein [Hymenobacter sp. ASUV-10]MDO7874090.1 M12 family metallo-peptidase [Hymenobacter sp. ASUV-10]
MFQTLPVMRRSWQRLAVAGLLSVAAPLGASAQKVLWANNPDVPTEASKFTAALSSYRAIEVNMAAMRTALLPAPAEQGAGARNSNVVISLPLPEGGSQRFRVTQVPVMAPALAAKFPEIKTYQAQGVDDPSAVARLDVSSLGFHAMVISPTRTFYIDPALRYGDDVHHLVFNKNAMNTKVVGFRCFNDESMNVATPGVPGTAAPAGLQRQSNGTQLRTFRLALSNTPEYARTKGNTAAGVIAGKVASINRVSGVYELEIACRLVLIPNNDQLTFLSGTGTQPSPTYTDASGPLMLDQNQQNVDRIIGNANYDIGHVFSTGGGGIAQRPSVCVNSGKARGVTGLPNPVGDAFDIDFVAHEIGHQFNGNHTFHASNAGNCVGGSFTPPNSNPTRATTAAYEPGSGVTIMAYAGICSPEDIADNSIPYFHSKSFDEILSHLTSSQGNCAVTTPTNNGVPVPEAGANYIIPRSTPFVLTGSGTDPNGDPLTYMWEQFDLGTVLTTVSNPQGDAPIFRDFVPTTSPTRYFPRLSDLVNNTTNIGERLPTYARNLNFRFVARDNRVGGGAVDYDAMSMQVVGTAGPFLVTLPNTSSIVWQAGAPAQVTWDVANTTAAPINAANVDILLSNDGGFTYPITLATAVPNDGSETITVPLTAPTTNTARVMVRANGNVFFDISNQNFRVVGNSGPTFFLAPAATPATLSACPGASASTTISVGQITGFTGTVALSANNLPAGINVTYGTPSVTVGSTPGTSTVTVNVAASTAPGTYALTLSGTSGSVTQVQTLSFVVQPAATGTASATSPNSQGGIPTSYRPRFVWSAVANATGYELQVATDNTFAAGTLVLGTPITVTTNNYTPTANLNPTTTYYWRVRALSPCATAPFSAVQTFRTGIQTCVPTVATNVPRPIFLTAGVTANSVTTIASTERVGEVRLRNLAVTHSAVEEVEVTLINPQGVSVVVIPRGTCPGTADINLSFDDLATAAISCPLTSNATVRPANPLNALTGSPANGNWTLSVSDNMAGNGGRITAWTLELCLVGEVPAAPSSLTVIDAGRANNTTTLQSIWTMPGTGGVPTYYEIQRSPNNNQNFTLLNTLQVPAQAQISGGIYEDVLYTSGQYFYRVRACNTNGCSEWTNEAVGLSAQQSAQQLGVAVYPNPSTGTFNLSIDNSQRGAVALRVTDALGRTVAQEQLSKNGTVLQHSLDLGKLATGVYQLHLTLPQGTVVQRLLKN